ncbi:hydrogenase expression/formation protein HypE, partial [bacterium]|nr:hydrogenase expression/formation protein HypE [bacterium]
MKTEKILLGHGSGGTLSQNLIDEIFVPAFKNSMLEVLNDQAVFDVEKGKIAFTTDSFVVDPIFFRGGNIGDLAVNGTVNDVAMSGAIPKFLSCGFILEVGFEIEKLKIIVQSMKKAAENAQVLIVTGDTKVVECRGKEPQIFINTSGIGFVPKNVEISVSKAQKDDVVILSGTIGEHGLAILSEREGFEFEIPFESDTVSLGKIVAKLVTEINEIHTLRDVTRGGLASILNEIAEASDCCIELEEKEIPVKDAVRGACEMLGLDPTYVANEGKFIIILPEKFSQKALKILHSDEAGKDAKIIG